MIKIKMEEEKGREKDLGRHHQIFEELVKSLEIKPRSEIIVETGSFLVL